MTQLTIGFIAIISMIVYILIGWFIRALVQDDWEKPSLSTLKERIYHEKA